MTYGAGYVAGSVIALGAGSSSGPSEKATRAMFSRSIDSPRATNTFGRATTTRVYRGLLGVGLHTGRRCPAENVLIGTPRGGQP